MILLYHFTPYDGAGDYFSGNEPKNIFCDKCQCVLNHAYVPTRIELRRHYDLASTYDNRTIVSEAFKQFCEREKLEGVEFKLVNERLRLYLLRLHNVLHFDASRSSTRLGKVCSRCGQHEFIVGFEPIRLRDLRVPIEHGLFRSDLLFGTTYAQTPLEFAGIETKRRIEAMRFRGVLFEPVTDE